MKVESDSNHAFKEDTKLQNMSPVFANIIANIMQPKRHKGQLQGLSKNSASSGNPQGSQQKSRRKLGTGASLSSNTCTVALYCTSSLCFFLKFPNHSLKYEHAQTATDSFIIPCLSSLGHEIKIDKVQWSMPQSMLNHKDTMEISCSQNRTARKKINLRKIGTSFCMSAHLAPS